MEKTRVSRVLYLRYFEQNISFELDIEKRAGMKTFLELARKLEKVEIQ